jgi:HK97 family phage portal protein
LKLLGFEISRKSGTSSMSIDTLIKRLEAVYETSSGVAITPENCEQSPTVKAIVTAVTRRFAVMPVHVYRKTLVNGRASKELQPSHPVEKLLNKPNDWQARTSYWMDASSWLLRYGNFYAFKARGNTGPIRRLLPLSPGQTEPKQSDDWAVTYHANLANGSSQDYDQSQVHHARLVARDGLKGDSPVMDVREAIAMEIAAEKFGASLFGNGAMPGLIFKYMDGSQGHKTDEERAQFVVDVQNIYSRKGRFKAMMLPKGIDLGTQIGIENDKAQFLGLRQYQRTVIAGAWGCPPHLVGDLSKGTFNNVEQQDQNFTTNMILPFVRIFEAAMERDLLTDQDRAAGIIIRFNPDATLRADFLARQQGLAVQRVNGVINANEWREHEGMNPRADDGGDSYYVQGPSGQQPSSGGDQEPTDPSPTEDENNAD